jgi:site-specific DNA recombinase
MRDQKEELDMTHEVENPVLAAYRKSENINELTRDILIQLVDHIRIYENGSICVKLRFADEFHVMKEESDV